MKEGSNPVIAIVNCYQHSVEIIIDEFSRSRVVSPVSRFARESFRPGSFRPESFCPWVVSPLSGGSFHPCFLLKHQGLSQAMFGDIYGGLDFPTISFR